MRAGVIVQADDLEWVCDTQGPVLRVSDPWLRCWVDDDLGVVWVADTNGWCCVPMDMHIGIYGAPRPERRVEHAERVASTELEGAVLGLAMSAVMFSALGIFAAYFAGELWRRWRS